MREPWAIVDDHGRASGETAEASARRRDGSAGCAVGGRGEGQVSGYSGAGGGRGLSLPGKLRSKEMNVHIMCSFIANVKCGWCVPVDPSLVVESSRILQWSSCM